MVVVSLFYLPRLILTKARRESAVGYEIDMEAELGKGQRRSGSESVGSFVDCHI